MLNRESNSSLERIFNNQKSENDDNLGSLVRPNSMRNPVCVASSKDTKTNNNQTAKEL